jgi:predicted AAA+ superfamily ATPase
MDSVVLKDVIERHHVTNVSALKHLVRAIMSAPGGKFSVNKFYNSLQSMSIKCTKNSLYDYLDHLIDAFVFAKIPIHTRSEKARQLNPPKIYTIDTGLLNAVTFRNSADHGPLLENLVFMHLRRNACDVEYVTTSDGYETDFLVRDPRTGDRQLIQVCWDISAPKTLDREIRGLKSAMNDLRLTTATIVTWDDQAELDNGIRAVPIWKYLLEARGEGPEAMGKGL